MTPAAANGRVLDYAAGYLAAGLSVVPVLRDGSKAPAVKWEPYMRRLATDAELVRWFGRAEPFGIGLIGGKVSGNAEHLDFDALADVLFPQWRELVEAECPGLTARLWVGRTPRPGWRVSYRCPDAVIDGNTKIATDPDRPKDDRTLIETRGEGGYTLAPGSPVECHPDRRPWEFKTGPDPYRLPSITAAVREVLWRCARSFDRQRHDDPKDQAGGGDDLRPGDDYNARPPSWKDLLEPHGWKAVKQSGKATYWARPDKGRGWSASSGYCTSKSGVPLLAVFSTNADPFEGMRGDKPSCYSPFAVYCLLNHGGDYSAAAKELARQGYGRPAKVCGGEAKAPDAAPTAGRQPAAVVIRDFLHARYRPTFRRGGAIFSDVLGREVRRAEAIAGAPAELIDQLAARAEKPPRTGDGEINYNALPRFYREWAPTGWADLLWELPDEEGAAELSGRAGEEFRTRVRAGLLRLVSLGFCHAGAEETRVEKRTVIDWCRLFAKPTGWGDVRGHMIWSKREGGVLRVALRPDVFGQVGGDADLPA
jgi:hypothetical protein